MTSANTVAGWLTLLAVAGAFYWVNHQRKNKNRRPLVQKVSSKIGDAKETRSKKTRKEGLHTTGDSVGKGQREQKTGGNINSHATVPIVAAPIPNDEADDREFARQLQNAKSGTIAAPKTQASGRPKSVKQRRAQEKVLGETSSDNTTAPSSINDANDNNSPHDSPRLSATATSSPITSGGIADMLEEPAPPASVLKVLAPTTPSLPQKAKIIKTIEPMESKKQRQNRQKSEQAKALRAQEEVARKVKMEQQRRTAREAEGRAPKDGSAFMASKAPTTSAWAASPIKPNGQSTTEHVELLDTYDQSDRDEAIANKSVYSESEEHGSALKSVSAMTEEEQVRIAIEQSENWNLVKSKEKKNRGKTNMNGSEQAKGDRENFTSSEEQKFYQPPPLTAPSQPGQVWRTTLTYVENGQVHEKEVDLKDSEWEVC